MNKLKTIDSLVEEFCDKFIYFFPGDYNWGDPIEPHDKMRENMNPIEYTEFVRYSLLSLLSIIEQKINDLYPLDQKDILIDDFKHGKFCGRKETLEEITNIIKELKK